MTGSSLNKQDGRRKRFSWKIMAAAALCVALLVVGVTFGVSWFEKNQVLSKAAAQRMDLRSFRTALETYQVDTGVLPDRMERLTTPVAYLSAFTRDIFNVDGNARYYLHASGDATKARWVVWSVGPDGLSDLDAHLLEKRLSETDLPTREALEIFHYDVTNGTLSEGDVFITDSDWD
jgi:hypothetical protein